MPDDSLISEAQPDRFTHESPIRAFTEFRVSGTWAIGKGFRPSLAHLHTYLDAMQRKEGWHLVQLLDGGTLDPTLIFQRDRVMSFTVPERKIGFDDLDAWMKEAGFSLVGEPTGDMRLYRITKLTTGSDAIDLPGEDTIIAHGGRVNVIHGPIRDVPEDSALIAAFDSMNDLGAPHGVPLLVKVSAQYRETECSGRFLDDHGWHIITRMDGDQVTSEPMRGGPLAWRHGPRDDWQTAAEWHDIEEDIRDLDHHQAKRDTAAGLPDDPVNPRHYGGTACAEIGERLTANSFQVLRYNWRLGEKDNPCVELGKSIWYLEREIALGLPGNFNLPSHEWFDERLRFATDHARAVGRILISWNRYGNKASLRGLLKNLQRKKDEMADECSEWGRGLEP